ncbi:reverse transcriptase domain-containing protein, partial [Solemya velum gill symbiont]|uniref:reverse transcriptase domain-containing protein n=1 Tax=Solemya velum gill symbiont TaxID=2340 RepID=UPI0015C3281B
PADLKFRPIIGGPNSATQRLSHLLDLILKPLCKEVPSFVRDDIDFLQKLPETVTSNATLVSFDIVSLYTNIPHELGIQAVQYWLSKNKGTIDTRFDQELIIDALKIVLQRNIFYFNGNYYIQKSGTAMGTKMAPTYATLVLGYLEEILRERMREKYGETFAVYLKNNWKRFLDDCFIIWTENIPIEA